MVGRSPGFMRGELLWFILRDGVNWSPCNLEMVCEQEYAQLYTDDIRYSKTFKLLSDQLSYGASNLVSKRECVGHVQKKNGYGSKREGKGEVCE